MNWIYLLFSAAFYILSYSPFDNKILIFVSFIILIVIIENLPSKKKALHLFLYAFIIHLLGVSWVSQSLLTYGSLDYLGSLLITLTFIIIISLPYVIIGILHKPIKENRLTNINLFALLFVSVEFIKSWIFGGFPWLLVGHSQSETIFNFIYPIFGSYAVTYIVVLISAILSKGWLEKSKSYVVFMFIFLIIYHFLPTDIADKDYDQKQKLTFTIYQPNIYPQESYDLNEYNNIQKKYINFLEKKISSELIIFPETIVPYELSNSSLLYKKMSEITNNDINIITGLFTKDKDKIFNSMVFFSEDIQIYNKRKLVPFGEYTPWYNTFFELAEALNIPLSNISHGSKNQKNIILGDIKIIPVICFESTFPNLVNSYDTKELLVNISNDSWFGNSLAPYQHLQISQIRALEFNRFILRATNTGISAVINNNGKVLNYIPNDTEGVISGTVPVNNKRSIYSQYGDIGILMLLFLSLLIMIVTRLTMRHE